MYTVLYFIGEMHFHWQFENLHWWLSQVPYTDISHKAKANVWPVIHRWRQKTDSFELVNAYGLFRRWVSWFLFPQGSRIHWWIRSMCSKPSCLEVSMDEYSGYLPIYTIFLWTPPPPSLTSHTDTPIHPSQLLKIRHHYFCFFNPALTQIFLTSKQTNPK